MRTVEVRTSLGVRKRKHSSWRRLVGVVAATASVFALAACGSSDEDSDGPQDNPTLETGNTKEGGEVTMVQTGLRDAYDPISGPAFGFTTGGPMNAIYGNMAYVDSATNEVELGFLDSLEPNDDFTVWTAKLHPGLKFSDGTPFDAEAVVFNIERAEDAELGSLFVVSASRITAEVVDDTTYTMTLEGPNQAFPAIYSEHFPYVGSPTAIKAAGTNFGTEPVGAGPFKVEEIDGANSLTLVPNEYYSDFAPGEPRLDKLTFTAVPEFSKQAQALAADQAQIAAPYGGDATKMFQDLPNVNTLVNLTGGGPNLHMSENRPPFDDPRAREAITLALDRASVSNAFQPGTPASTSLFPDDSPYYDASLKYPEQNKERAQELFDELAAEGKPVKFDYLAADQTQIQICAQLLLSQLSEFDNVDMTIKSVTTDQYITDQRAGNYQMAPVGLYLINPIPELEDYYYTGGSLNTFGYSNPDVDAAFDTLKTEQDPAKQAELYKSIQAQVNKDFVAYWVGQGMMAFAVSDQLLNVTPVNYGNAPLWGPLGYKA
jgi:ABC-type transport system substrate-binding protein